MITKQDVKMVQRAVTRLTAVMSRLVVLPDDLGPNHVRLPIVIPVQRRIWRFLPGMSMNYHHMVSRMTARLQDPHADLVTCGRREDRSLRI